MSFGKKVLKSLCCWFLIVFLLVCIPGRQRLEKMLCSLKNNKEVTVWCMQFSSTLAHLLLPCRVAVLDKVTDFLLFLGKLFISGSVGEFPTLNLPVFTQLGSLVGRTPFDCDLSNIWPHLCFLINKSHFPVFQVCLHFSSLPVKYQSFKRRCHP